MVLIGRRSHQAGLGEPPGSVPGSLAIAGSATVAIGPPIGGLLAGGLGWRSAFLLNVALAVAALAQRHPGRAPDHVTTTWSAQRP